MDARELFYQSHMKALRQDLVARLEGRPNDLLPYEALAEVLQVHQQIPRSLPETIPLDKIVGSVGRYKDFTQDFQPRNAALRERWVHIEEQMNSMAGLPPIEAYKLGEVYFVADGNHRVSVARANGFSGIDAYVTEIPIDPGLAPGDTLDQAIIKVERTRFMVETGLDQRLPHLDIYFTKPGGFHTLLEHIEIHRRFMVRQAGPDAGVTTPDAAADWYMHTYQPIISAIRDRRLLQSFPNRTAADLYVWVWGMAMELHKVYGEQVSPDEAAELVALRAPSPFRKAVGELMGRLAQFSHVFGNQDEQVPEWAASPADWGDLAFAPAWEEKPHEYTGSQADAHPADPPRHQ